MQQRIAVRAVIRKGDTVLMIREAPIYAGGTNHGTYDFVGGKVAPGETVEEAIVRECAEEAGILVDIGKPFFVDEWRPEIKGQQVQIICVFFLCEAKSNEVRLGPDFDEYQWVALDAYESLPIMKGYEKIFAALKELR